MKWFKHYSDASDDDFIESLEEKFGLEGYARWWKILEIIAKGMDKNPSDPTASHPMQKWCSLLRAKPKVLLSFLEHSGNKSRMKWKQNGNIIEISVPNLLKIRDEYTRKSGHTPDKLPAKKKETEKERIYDVVIGAREVKTHEKNDFEIIYNFGCELFPSLATRNTSSIQKWLSAGFNPTLDIIATIKNHKGKNIGSWNYFDQMIADAHATRLKPLQKGTAHESSNKQPAKPKSWTEAGEQLAAKYAAQAELEEQAAIGGSSESGLCITENIR
jgi:hypothetical protein